MNKKMHLKKWYSIYECEYCDKASTNIIEMDTHEKECAKKKRFRKG